MSKAVLISIQPKWCELIANGKKTIEVRKTRPKLDTPFKCYIYQTKRTWIYNIYSAIADWRGKVIGEFVCDRIENFKKFEYGIDALHRHIKLNACMGYDEIYNYLGLEKCGYGWHISNLKIYDKPKELGEFGTPNDCHRGNEKHQCIGCWDCEIKRPPQSWCYVEQPRKAVQSDVEMRHLQSK